MNDTILEMSQLSRTRDEDGRRRSVGYPETLAGLNLELEQLADPDVRSVAISHEHPEFADALEAGRDQIVGADGPKAPRRRPRAGSSGAARAVRQRNRRPSWRRRPAPGSATTMVACYSRGCCIRERGYLDPGAIILPMTAKRKIVVSGAPATGKSTVAAALADHLSFPLLSLDTIKETLADVLGTRGEAWSYLLGDAAAELVFRLSAAFPFAIVEGWWRGERRARATQEFAGWTEIFCRCEPSLAEQRMRMRQRVDRHRIHRDMINPAVTRQAASLAQTVSPLGVGPTLIEIDTTSSVAWDQLISTVREVLPP